MIAALLALVCAAPYDTAWSQQLPEGAQVTVPAGNYLGPWNLADRVTLHASGARLSAGDAGVALRINGAARVDGLSVEASANGYGIRIERGGSAELSEVKAAGPGVALVYVVDGSLRVSGGELRGGQYGVLTERATAISLSNVDIFGQERAGVAVVNGSFEVGHCRFRGPFSDAAISLVHADGGLNHNRIGEAGAVGIKVVTGSARLAHNAIAGARTDARGLEGEGVYAYESTVALDQDQIEDCQSTGLSAIGSQVQISKVVFRRAGEVAVYVSGSRLSASGCSVSQSPTGLALEQDAIFDGGGFTYDKVPLPVAHLAP